MSEKRFHHVTPEGDLRPVADLAEGKAALRSGGYLWLDFADPERADLEPLVRELGIHPLSIEDCLDKLQIPKLDLYAGSSFLVFNSYALSGGRLRVGEIDLILGKEFLVTVSGRSGEDQRFHEHVAGMVRADRENVRQGPDRLLYVVLNHIVDDKSAAVEALQRDIDAAEEAILRDTAGFQLSRLVRQRRGILGLVKLCRRDSPFVGEAAVYHLRDVYDHLTKYFEEAEIQREMLLGLTEMHLSLVNNQMSQIANRTNNSVRRLTYISVIFLPLMFLSGVGGMSEYSMMTGAHSWRLAYPAFLGAMAAIGAAMYLVVRWFDRRGLATGEG